MLIVNKDTDRTGQYSPFIVIMYEYLMCELVRVENGPNYKMRIYLDDKLVFRKFFLLAKH